MERHERVHLSLGTESKEIHRLPMITFRLDDSEGNDPYREDLLLIQSAFEPAWREVESGVMTSYEAVSGGIWDTFSRTNGIAVTLSAIEGSRTRPHTYLKLGCREVKSKWAKQQGLLGTMRDVTSLQGSLIHELGHNFMNRDDMHVLQTLFGQRFQSDTADLNEKAFFSEVYAELISHAVAEENFTEEEYSPWRERQRLGHRGVYDFLDTLTEEEKKLIIERDHLWRLPIVEVEQKTNKRLHDIRTRVRNIFNRN